MQARRAFVLDHQGLDQAGNAAPGSGLFHVAPGVVVGDEAGDETARGIAVYRHGTARCHRNILGPDSSVSRYQGPETPSKPWASARPLRERGNFGGARRGGTICRIVSAARRGHMQRWGRLP